MKLMLTAGVCWLGLSAAAAAQEQPWTFGQLLRGVHVAAYTSPAICPGDDGLALYTFNATGRDAHSPATRVSHLTYDIVGVFPDGRAVIADGDRGRSLADVIEPFEEVIRCIRSESRRQGASHFSLVIRDARILD